MVCMCCTVAVACSGASVAPVADTASGARVRMTGAALLSVMSHLPFFWGGASAMAAGSLIGSLI